MSKNEPKLVSKISPLIEGQVPDFVQADHPLFVTFLKHYYEFLEAAELKLTVTVESIIQEKEVSEYIFLEGGEKIILEKETGSTGKFSSGETISGSLSKATAKVLVDDSSNGKLFISSDQRFITGETIVGATSGAQGVLNSYRANPVQNIQQLLEYADVDNTIYDFLDNFRNQFMDIVPNTLASGASKRNLIKSIKELYTAKGTSEGHKLFLRMLLDEESEIIYPNKFMLKVSDGLWVFKTIMRCSAGLGVPASEVIGKTITGDISKATAIVVSATVIQEGGDTIINFELDPNSLSGTFNFNEKVTGVSSVTNRLLSFTSKGIIGTGPITNDGILYSDNEQIHILKPGGTVIEGNELANVKVDTINTGSINELVVDAAGTNYKVGEPLIFSSQPNTSTAKAFVSSVGGGFGLEDDSGSIQIEDSTYQYIQHYNMVLDGTDSSGTDAGSSLLLDGGPEYDNIILEVFSNTKMDTIFLEMEDGTSTTDIIMEDGISDALQMEIGTHGYFAALEEYGDDTYHGDIILEDATIGLGAKKRGNHYLLESHSITADENSRLLSELEIVSNDTYGANTDNLLLETHTFSDLGVESESSSIYKISLTNEGSGYRSLPTVSVNSVDGSGSKIIASTNDIGSVQGLRMENVGFDYIVAPEPVFKAHLILKNVTGNFTTSSDITTHNVTVENYTGTYAVGVPASQLLTVRINKPETIIFDRTDLPNVDQGDDILFEDDTFLVKEDYSYENLFIEGTSITDSDGNTGTIHKADIASGSLTNEIIVKKAGVYDSFRSKLGEDIVRLQDSFYYQDFSYEIQIGAASIDYMNEIKKAVHPSGFLPFGKVSMASKIVASMQIPTGKDVVGYTGDTDTFTPELASTFINLVTTVFGRRLGTSTDGFTMPSYDTRALGGSSEFPNTTKELLLTAPKNIKLEIAQPIPVNIPTGKTNLANYPFSAIETIEVEYQTSVLNPTEMWSSTSLTFDDTGVTFDSGLSGVSDNIILNGNVSNFSSRSYVGDINGNIIWEDGTTGQNFNPTFNEIGTIKFDDIFEYFSFLLEDDTVEGNTVDRLIQEDNTALYLEQQPFAIPIQNYTETNPLMFGISTDILVRYTGRIKGDYSSGEEIHIILDGMDGTSTDAGSFIQIEDGTWLHSI